MAMDTGKSKLSWQHGPKRTPPPLPHPPPPPPPPWLVSRFVMTALRYKAVQGRKCNYFDQNM